MQFLAQSDKISLVSGLQARFLRKFGGTMEGNHHLAVATLHDPWLKKLAFRDQTAAQQGTHAVAYKGDVIFINSNSQGYKLDN